MVETFLKWLFGIINAYSHKNPVWTRDDWGDVSEWHNGIVKGYWHEAACAGWMDVGDLMRVEKDPIDQYKLYIGTSLVLWSRLDPRWRGLNNVWRAFGDILYHGQNAWEIQTGPIIWQLFYEKPAVMTGFYMGRLRASRDWYWNTKVRLGIKRAWRKAKIAWAYQWFTWA